MKKNFNPDDEDLDSFAEAAVKYNIEKELRLRYSKKLAQQNKKSTWVKYLFSKRIVAAAAAVSIIVFGSIFLFQTFNTSITTTEMAQRYVDNTIILGNQDITRKGSSTVDVLQRNANDAFVKKDYALAITNYEKLKSTQALSALDNFYLATSYLKQKNYEKAIILFNKLKNINYQSTEEVDWLLSLAYLLSEKNEEAISLLTIIATNDQYKAKEAKILLDKIKN